MPCPSHILEVLTELQQENSWNHIKKLFRYVFYEQYLLKVMGVHFTKIFLVVVQKKMNGFFYEMTSCNLPASSFTLASKTKS